LAVLKKPAMAESRPSTSSKVFQSGTDREGLRQFVIDLASRGFSASEIRARLEALKPPAEAVIDYSGPQVPKAGHRAHDALIDDLIVEALRATSRERLAELVVLALSGSEYGSPAVMSFVLEMDSSHGRRGIRLRQHSGHIAEAAWKAFETNISGSESSSAYLEFLFQESRPTSIWHSHFIETYDGIFDLLARAANLDMSIGYWIGSTPLPAGRIDVPRRVLVAIYPSRGSAENPALPPGVNRDERVLRMASRVQELLSERLAVLADDIQMRRRELVALIAPGLIAHEIGALTTSLGDRVKHAKNSAMMLVVDAESSARLTQLVDDLDKGIEIAADIKDIGNAFNNLEKRGSFTKISVRELMHEIELLVAFRMKDAGVFMDAKRISKKIAVTCDHSLLLHALMNVVVNAINAMAEAPRRIKGRRGLVVTDNRIVVLTHGVDRTVKIVVANTGPAIPIDLMEKIFQRGFTTRQQGHGQGLYLARDIVRSFGGDIRCLAQDELPKDCNAGFALVIPKVATSEQDVAGLAHEMRKK
jgi:signal transduction histidine kinase